MARELVNWDVIITFGAVREFRREFSGLIQLANFSQLTSSLSAGNDPRCTKVNRVVALELACLVVAWVYTSVQGRHA